MKQNLSWHQKNLDNMNNFLTDRRRALVSVLNHIQSLENSISFLKLQIEEAQKNPSTESFDSATFLKNKKDTIPTPMPVLVENREEDKLIVILADPNGKGFTQSLSLRSPSQITDLIKALTEAWSQ